MNEEIDSDEMLPEYDFSVPGRHADADGEEVFRELRERLGDGEEP
jgi:hypothetical protein